MPSPLFPRHVTVLILTAIACSFAGNHVAARIAFDHDAGLLLAILCRAGVTLAVLVALVAWRRDSLRMPTRTAGWQLLLGLLIATQSLCIYSAVARIPVGVALLLVNLSPIFLILLSWALGGPRPSARTALVLAVILCGLVLVLDVPTRLAEAQGGIDARWLEGVLFAVGGAMVFAVALWVTEHRLGTLVGPVRSMLTLAVVFSAASLAGVLGALPGGLTLPNASAGWIALACLVALYGVAFSALFICMPRLDIARNAPVMNVEPVAGMCFGWLVLEQLLGVLQVLGGLLVVAGIVLLSWPARRAAG